MTTEEMNRVIEKYMQSPFEPTPRLYYHLSWNALMPVWQKLRGELMLKATDIYAKSNYRFCSPVAEFYIFGFRRSRTRNNPVK